MPKGGNPRNSPNHPRRMQAAERRNKAVTLRMSGASFAQIAKALDMSVGAAHKAVTTAMAELAEQTMGETEKLRALECARLDRAQAAIWTAVTNGNHGAIDRLLRIMERRAKLLGLDAPAKTAITDPTGEEDALSGYVVIPQECEDVDEWVKQHAQPH